MPSGPDQFRQQAGGLSCGPPSRPTFSNPKAALLTALVALAAAAAAGQVFMSEPEALKIISGNATWTEEVKTLEEKARQSLTHSTRLRFPESSYRFQVARAAGNVEGYALTLDEIGKSEPITFTVGLDPAGRVTEVILLVFRESRGAEVRDRRFLRQFRGKSLGNPVRVGDDILNYAGATLSSQALARGVRKALALFEHFYGPGAGLSREVSPATSAPHAAAAAGVDSRPPQEMLRAASTVHYVQARYLMGTVYAVEVYAPTRSRAEQAASAAFEAVKEVDRRMSNFRTDSELSRLNRLAAERPVEVSDELFTVLAFAQRLSEWSEGAFDITVAPLLRVWGFLPARLAARGAEENQNALALPGVPVNRATRAVLGYQKVRLDPLTRTVRFAMPGVELDLGGIAKGFAVDRAAKALRQSGITSARLSAGGSTIYALGAPPGKPPGWQIILPSGVPVTVRNAAISTSGHTEHFREVAGRRYSHIIDPRRGEPVSDRIATVSVQAPTAMESDALTKPFFVLNERAQAKLRRHFPGLRLWLDPEPPRRVAGASN